jgi:hypothetical protein
MRKFGKVSAIALAAACLVGGSIVSVPSPAKATTVVDLCATFSDTGLNSGLQHAELTAAFTLIGDVISTATGFLSGSFNGALTLLPVDVHGAASLPSKNPNDNVLTGSAYYFSTYGTLFIVGTPTPDGTNKESILGLDLFTFGADHHIRASLFDAVFNYSTDTLSSITFLTPTGGTGTGDIDANSLKSIDRTVSITPLPSSWTMLIAGFVGFGFLAYRGTKKNAAVAAA